MGLLGSTFLGSPFAGVGTLSVNQGLVNEEQVEKGQLPVPDDEYFASQTSEDGKVPGTSGPKPPSTPPPLTTSPFTMAQQQQQQQVTPPPPPTVSVVPVPPKPPKPPAGTQLTTVSTEPDLTTKIVLSALVVVGVGYVMYRILRKASPAVSDDLDLDEPSELSDAPCPCEMGQE